LDSLYKSIENFNIAVEDLKQTALKANVKDWKELVKKFNEEDKSKKSLIENIKFESQKYLYSIINNMIEKVKLGDNSKWYHYINYLKI